LAPDVDDQAGKTHQNASLAKYFDHEGKILTEIGKIRFALLFSALLRFFGIIFLL
jgi:hypothetical protein